MLMICPEHKDCEKDVFDICKHRSYHEKYIMCDVASECGCQKCVPVKEDNKDEEEIICKPIDPNRSY